MSWSGASFTTPSNEALSLRFAVAADLPRIAALLIANQPIFSADECKLAATLARAAIEQAEGPARARCLVAEYAGTVVAFACFGPVPLAKGTYDLYWLAVHPSHHSRGIGRALLLRCEREMRTEGARLLIVETAGRPSYEQTRRFYTDVMGYELAARIRDFYQSGDDKLIYAKYL